MSLWNGLSAAAVGLETLGAFKGYLDGNLSDLFYCVEGS